LPFGVIGRGIGVLNGGPYLERAREGFLGGGGYVDMLVWDLPLRCRQGNVRSVYCLSEDVVSFEMGFTRNFLKCNSDFTKKITPSCNRSASLTSPWRRYGCRLRGFCTV